MQNHQKDFDQLLTWILAEIGTPMNKPATGRYTQAWPAKHSPAGHVVCRGFNSQSSALPT
jgi:hypothetical protein